MSRPILYLIWSFVAICASPQIHAQQGLVINEIMANPNGGQLPLYEYLEIYNNGNQVAQLSEYTLFIGNNRIALPQYRLAPRQYLLLCSETAFPAFQSYGNVVPLSTWYALNNSSATLKLVYGENLQDSVSYNDTWYNHSTKRRGGWSLERINPNIICNTPLNWTASVNPMGGTPCRANAVQRTTLPHIYVTEWTIVENGLRLLFNEKLENFDLSHVQMELSPGEWRPQHIEVNEEGYLDLHFSQQIPENILLHLHISNLLWCEHLLAIEDTPIFLQNGLQYNDVVINEILFNPKPGGVDFVELLNQSNHAINLQGWRLGNRLITNETLILQPQEHLALSISPTHLQQHYPTNEQQRLQQMPSLPAYPNQQGNVMLYAGNMLMDSLYYNADFHSALLKDVKGISLERQSPERPTNEIGNFRSASTMSGGATPGYKNSTYSDFDKKITFFLSSKTMSPNDDSFEDFLEINYELDRPNYMINIHIFSDRGALVNRLIRHQSAGFSGRILWDGRAENGRLCPPGIYLCEMEIYDDNGHRTTRKEAFVVTYMSAGS